MTTADKPTIKSSNNIIEGKGLHKVFDTNSRTVSVINGIDINIEKGDFSIIFGPSGCGKTTFINMLLGLEKPTKGDVHFLGSELTAMDADQRAVFRKQNVGIIYQQPNWIKSLTVVENVAFPLILRGVEESKAIERAMDLLDKLNMMLWCFYNPSELSSGQQQKVALARAIITDPDIIFADEPTGNLDYENGKALMNLFSELNENGKTIIMITHNIAHLSFAKKVLHMFDGKVVDTYKVTPASLPKIQKKLLSENDKNAKTGGATFEEMKSYIDKKAIKKQKRIRAKVGEIILSMGSHLKSVFQFIPLFVVYLINKFFEIISKSKPGRTKVFTSLKTSWEELYAKFISLYDNKKEASIHKVQLLNNSLKNLYVKGSRSLVTIGGMAVGIGFIVLLVSIGYGVERLVLTRIGDLDRKKQIESMPAVSSNITLDQNTLLTFSKINGVTEVLPLLSVAGKIDYNNSVTDAVAYGVDPQYLEKSDLRLVEGNLAFDDVKSDSQDVEGSAVLNLALLGVFGIEPKEIIGKSIELTFSDTVDKETLAILGEEDSESVQASNLQTETKLQYIVTGVIDEGENPVLYTELDSLYKQGFSNYSQVKVIAATVNDVPIIRQQIEASGFSTISILDTINQIETLFSSLRFGLAVIGIIALTIASLGMFNTLTVSLLERTREIGLMKAIGMQSSEVYNLFQIESMVMGILGGIFGIVFGFAFGKLISIVLSAVAIAGGSSAMDVSYVPFTFSLIVLLMSVAVGVVTGYYPAKRATDISPLDAIRYE